MKPPTPFNGVGGFNFDRFLSIFVLPTTSKDMDIVEAEAERKYEDYTLDEKIALSEADPEKLTALYDAWYGTIAYLKQQNSWQTRLHELKCPFCADEACKQTLQTESGYTAFRGGVYGYTAQYISPACDPKRGYTYGVMDDLMLDTLRADWRAHNVCNTDCGFDHSSDPYTDNDTELTVESVGPHLFEVEAYGYSPEQTP